MFAINVLVFILIFRDIVCRSAGDYGVWSDYDELDLYRYRNARYEHNPSLWSREFRTSSENSYPIDNCEDDEILGTKGNIIDQIHIVQYELNFVPSAYETYYERTDELRNKHVEALHDFLEKLQDRPSRVLNIIERMAEMRRGLTVDVDEIVTKMQEFTTYEDQIDRFNDRFNRILEQLDAVKKFCPGNCKKPSIDPRVQVGEMRLGFLPSNADSETFSCLKLAHLQTTIYDMLSEHKEEYETELRNRLQQDDEIYTERLETLKSVLKNIAIAKFGTTMYDILSLQDEYYNFESFIKNNNISDELEQIKTIHFDIEHNLTDLETELEEYRKFCLGCSNQVKARHGVVDGWQQRQWNNRGLDFGYINALIKEEMIDLKHNITHQYLDLLEEIEENLRNPYVINSYVEQLTPIQNKISNVIAKEQDELSALKSKIPESSIAEVSAHLKSLQKLLKTIMSTTNYIRHLI